MNSACSGVVPPSHGSLGYGACCCWSSLVVVQTIFSTLEWCPGYSFSILCLFVGAFLPLSSHKSGHIKAAHHQGQPGSDPRKVTDTVAVPVQKNQKQLSPGKPRSESPAPGSVQTLELALIETGTMFSGLQLWEITSNMAML